MTLLDSSRAVNRESFNIVTPLLHFVRPTNSVADFF